MRVWILAAVTVAGCSLEAPPEIRADARPVDAPVAPDARVYTYAEPTVYWAFDSDDVSGTVLASELGAISGTLQGAIVGGEAIVGEGLVLDGTDDSVSFGDVLDDLFAGADNTFSASLWVRPTTVSSLHALLTKTGASGCTPEEDQREIAIVLWHGQPTLIYNTPANANSKWVASTSPVAPDVWHHLVVTYDGAIDTGAIDRVRIYVDGVPQPLELVGDLGTFPFDVAPTTAYLSIGEFLGSTNNRCGNLLGGAMDELALWHQVLTADEAAELTARGREGRAIWPRD